MEKYSQYRDRGIFQLSLSTSSSSQPASILTSCAGSGISPFLPVNSATSTLYLPVRALLFVFKLPFFLFFSLFYFVILQHLPLGALFKKASLWTLLGLPGIWWIDLQIDGVKKGQLAKEKARLPSDGSIIASSFTSPVDGLYLAAIFDPIFTASYPHTRQVRQISLLQAMLRALSSPETAPPPGAQLLPLSTLLERNPKRIIVVFPECTTTNGKGILPLSPSLLSAPHTTKIFPVNLRYSPPDITTPIPGSYWGFAWKLLSQQTHCIRVRIAEATLNDSVSVAHSLGSVRGGGQGRDKYLENLMESMGEATQRNMAGRTASEQSSNGPVTETEQKVLDRVGEALARLGRVKRVGLTVADKTSFVKAWTSKRK